MRAGTLSDFLRHSGAVLEATGRSDVVLRRRSADDLYLTTFRRHRERQEAAELLAGAVRACLDAESATSVMTKRLPEYAPWTSALGPNERRQLLEELCAAVRLSADLGVGRPVEQVLRRWRAGASARAEGVVSGHETRSVPIPDDVDDPDVEKARGHIELPHHIRWSGRPRIYDLDDRRDRALVYEQVLREGTEHDVRRYVDLTSLLDLWDDLVLPRRVREAWAAWLREARGIEVSC